jgi:hypothetical protein
MEAEAGDLAAHVDAAATLHALPLDAQRREAVIAATARLAAFAADLESVELGPQIEIAGAFVP